MKDPDTVLCVPGPWKDHSDLVARIGHDRGGYLFAGGVIMNAATGDSFELQQGETVAMARGAPGYRRFEEPRTLYNGDPLFANPYGMWRLQPK